MVRSFYFYTMYTHKNLHVLRRNFIRGQTLNFIASDRMKLDCTGSILNLLSISTERSQHLLGCIAIHIYSPVELKRLIQRRWIWISIRFIPFESTPQPIHLYSPLASFRKIIQMNSLCFEIDDWIDSMDSLYAILRL